MKNKTSINLEVSLVEIIISVLVFTISGVIMINCFAMARYTQIKSNDITLGSFKAQTFLEYVKSAKDTNEMCGIIETSFNKVYFDENKAHSKYVVFYDKNWDKCVNEDKLFSIELDVRSNELDSGVIDNIIVNVNRINRYPFIDKGSDSSLIFSVETKKFFPRIIMED